MSNEAFLDDNYEVPTGGGGFTKLETGDNSFRILSSPLLMWVLWSDGVPSRVKYTGVESKPTKGQGPKDSVKHAWGLIVWNYKTKSIEVFELDKQEIISNLTAYSKNPKWGHPKHYDIVINKSGAGMDTAYKLVVEPKEEPTQEVIDAFIETPIDLSKLLTGDSPFLAGGGSVASTTPGPTAKVVTPENWATGDKIPAGYIAQGEGIVKKELPF